MNEVYQATGQIPQDPTDNIKFLWLSAVENPIEAGITGDYERHWPHKGSRIVTATRRVVVWFGWIKNIQYFKPSTKGRTYIIFVPMFATWWRRCFASMRMMHGIDNNRTWINTIASRDVATNTLVLWKTPKPKMLLHLLMLHHIKSSLRNQNQRAFPLLQIPTTSSENNTNMNQSILSALTKTSKIGAKNANFKRRIREVKDKRVDKLKKCPKQDAEMLWNNVEDCRRFSLSNTYPPLLPFGKYAKCCTIRQVQISIENTENNAVRKYPKGISSELANEGTYWNNKAFDISTLNDEDKAFLYDLVIMQKCKSIYPNEEGNVGVPCDDKDA